MKKPISIIYFIVTLTCIPFVLSGQDFAQRNISAAEKQALEKQFQDLKTFYIDDDGTVVFQQKADSIDSNSESNVVVPKMKVKVSVDEYGDYVVTTEEPDKIFIEDGVVPTEADSSELEIEAQPEVLKYEEPVPVSVYEEQVVEATNEEEIADAKPQKEVFRKKVSSYKSLEEAALAVDQLLEELKKQQSQQPGNRGKVSLSQKASSGVNGSLRNKTYDFSEDSDTLTTTSSFEGEYEDDGEPTYYINGIESTKEDVNKLKKGEILKKTIKRSKTNPNGEWWIETRQK